MPLFLRKLLVSLKLIGPRAAATVLADFHKVVDELEHSAAFRAAQALELRAKAELHELESSKAAAVASRIAGLVK